MFLNVIRYISPHFAYLFSYLFTGYCSVEPSQVFARQGDGARQ